MKNFIIIFTLLFSFFRASAADYYWVGGGGGWSDLNHWRLGSPAGSIPSIVPSGSDNVTFGASSGFGITTESKTVVLDANAFCQHMTWTADVPNNPIFSRPSGTYILTITGSLILSSEVTYSSLPVTMTGASGATLTTNGIVKGSIALTVRKAGGSLTLVDDYICATPSGSGNVLILEEGTLNAVGKTVTVYSFASSGSSSRALDITNSTINPYQMWNYRGTNKTLQASGSDIKTVRFYVDEGSYNKVEAGTSSSDYLYIYNSSFNKLVFTSTNPGSLARIHTNNTVDTLIFMGSGSIRSQNNTVNYVRFAGLATIGGPGNNVKFAEMMDGLNIIDGGGNIFDTLLTAPNRNINISGTNTINKYFRAGGVPCDGFTEISGSGQGTLHFTTGAVADIDNVLLANLTATGSIAPITVNGIDNEGNSGFSIQSPVATGNTLYWVGGAGDWNEKMHWSTVSGGVGGACIPFIYDDVVFDANSGFAAGNNTVVTSGNTYCRNMTWTGVTANPVFNESNSFVLSVYGSVVLHPTVTMNAAMDLKGENDVTLATNGSTLGTNQYIIRNSGAGATRGLTLLDNWNNPNGSFVMVRGVLDLRNRTIDIQYFSGAGALGRFLHIDDASISVNNWVYVGTNHTMTADGSFILVRNAITTRGMVYNVVDCSGTNGSSLDIVNTTIGQLTFTNTSLTSQARLHGGNTVRRLEFKGQGMIRGNGNIIDSLVTAENRNFFFFETPVTTINKYFKASHPSCSGLGEVRSGTAAVSSIAFGANAEVDISNVYMENIAATGGGGSLTLPIPFSGADAGGNSGWTINSSGGSGRYWVGGSGDWNDAAHWSTTSGGLGGACIPTVGDDVYFDANSGFTAASRTVTVNNGNAYFHNMSWAGALNDPILTKSGAWGMECWGSSLILNPVSTLNISPLTMKGAEAAILTGQCKGNFSLLVDKAGSGLTLGNNFSNAAAVFTLLNGNFSTAGHSVMASVITNDGVNNLMTLDISGSTIDAGVRYDGNTSNRTLNAANSIINGSVILNGFTYHIINVSGTANTNARLSNVTVTSLTFTNPSASSAVGVNGANNNIGRLEYMGSGGMYGTNNTIDTLVFFPGNIYTFTAGTNTAITGGWYGSGTPCRLTEIKSSSTSSPATITKSSGTVLFDYIRLQQMSATGGASFETKEHSIDLGGNSGWTIAPYNGSSPILGLGADREVCASAFPIMLNTAGFFGAPSSQYLWNDGSNGAELSVNAPGTYSVDVSFPDGCSINGDIVITQTVVPVDPVTGSSTVCENSTTTLSSTTAGGVWSSSNTAAATVDASGVVTGIAAGTATITYLVTGGNGCTNSESMLVTVNAQPAVGPVTGTAAVCEGASTTLANAAAGGVWSSSNTAVATVNAAGIVTGIAAGTATITYEITNGSGCANESSVAVIVNPLPVVAAITGTATVCQGSSTTLSNVTPGGTWSSSNVAIATVDVIGTVTGVAAGTVTITYEVVNGSGCSKLQSLTVTVNAVPVADPVSGTFSVCAGSTTALGNTTPGGIWSSGNTSSATINAAGVVTGIAAGTSTIAYSITNGAGCTTEVTAEITVNALPVVDPVAGTTNVCRGATTVLTNATPSGVWSSGNTAVATISPAGIVTGVSAGTSIITYTVTNGSGCAASSGATVTVNIPPIVNPVTGTTEVCAGSTTLLSSTTPGGVWSSGNNAVAAIDASGLVTGIAAGSSLVTYRVTNAAGCFVDATATVTVNALPVVDGITGALTICEGSATALSNTTAGGVWSSDNNAVATVNSSGMVTGIAAGSAVISYTVTNGDGCVAEATAAVSVNPWPVLDPITGISSLCVGTSTALSNSTPGGTWSSSNPAVAVIDAGGLVTGLAAGTATITYTMTNGLGCSASRTLDMIINTPIIIGPITGNLNACAGRTSPLGSTTTGGIWSSSDPSVATIDADGIVTGISNGAVLITYTVNSGGSCFGDVTATVNVNTVPVVDPITGSGSVCQGAAVNFSNTTSGGVWASDNTAVATVDAGGVVSGIAAGTAAITYTVTNGIGCATEVNETITVDAAPVLTGISGTTSLCEGATVTWSNAATGGVWSSNNTAVATVDAGGTLTGISAGSALITYTVTNGAGCSADISATVTVQALPVVSAVTGTTDVCVGSATLLGSATPDGIWSSANTAAATVDAGGLVTGVAPGNTLITYTVTNGAGCETAVSISATVNAVPVVPAITGSFTVCEGLAAVLGNGVPGGTWSSNDLSIATVDAAGLVAGVSSGVADITYAVMNGAGCTTEVTAAVTVNAVPVVNAINGTFDVCAGYATALNNAFPGGVWSSSNPAVATVDAGGLVNGIATGSADIIYTVTNGAGCSTGVTATVAVNPLPVLAAITGTMYICEGLSTTLHNTTPGGTWTSDNNSVATVDAAGLVTGIAAGTAAITYTVVNGAGCSAEVSGVITVNPLPVLALITGNRNVCQGLAIQLANATPGGIWSSSNTAVATVDATGLVTGVSAGTVKITYTMTDGAGCSNSVTADVNVRALPVVNPVAGVLTVCESMTTALSNSTPGGVWSSGNPAIAAVSSGGVVTGIAAGTTAINYTVTNGSGCATSVVVSIIVNEMPVVPPVTGTMNVCQGGTAALANTTPGGTWGSSNTGVATIDGNGLVNALSAGTATVSYTVTNTDGCGISVFELITVNALPVVDAVAGMRGVCAGETTSLGNTTPGGVWSSGNTAVAAIDASGEVTGISAGTATITYTVTNAEGCTAEATAVITVSALPAPDDIGGSTIVCAGAATSLSNTTPGGIWSSSDGSVATVDAFGLVTGVTAGNARITYSITSGGCTASVSTDVDVMAIPVVMPVTGAGNVCVGETAVLGSVTPGGTWSTGNASIATISAAGVVTGIAAGTVNITYMVTNGTGCSVSETLAVTVNDCPANDPPVASDDNAFTYQSAAVTVPVTVNDFQNSGSINPASIIITRQPDHGSVAVHADGSVTYTPAPSYNGSDSFSYTVNNELGVTSNMANVTITIGIVPVAVTDSISTNTNATVVIPVLVNDLGETDRSGIIIAQHPSHGTITLNADGTVTYRPTPGYSGVDAFRYQMRDVYGTISNEATVYIIVGDNGMFIPNGITPNNDGINDRFEIPGIGRYPGSTLAVFNRWGNEVYYSPDYDNRWDGAGLSGGTYYYILKLKLPGGIKVYKGWIQLLR